MKSKNRDKVLRKHMGSNIAIFWIIYLLSGAILFHIAEGRRFFDSIYYAFTVMTTIGFGDFAPLTDIGKFLTMIFAVVGVPMFLVTSARLLQTFLKRHIQDYLYHIHKRIEQQEEHEEKVERRERLSKIFPFAFRRPS